MSEGPINFGKPLAILVLLGCIGGGYYAHKNWPYTYEVIDGQSYWSVKFPNSWEAFPAQDPNNASRVNFRGPMTEEAWGTGWAMTAAHGTITWPEMVVGNVGGTCTNVDMEVNIDQKKSLTYEYEDNQTRYVGAAVERGDVLVYVNIGVDKANFELFKEKMYKVVKSVKCHR